MDLPFSATVPRRGLGWPRLLLRGVLAGLALALLFTYGGDLRDEVEALDSWIAAAGVFAPLAFLVASVALIPIFFPVTAIKVLAGALFGPVLGVVLCLGGQFLAAVLMHAVGRRYLSTRLVAFVEHEPRLAIVRRAAERGTAQGQFLVRMTPLSFAFVSYLLAGLGAQRKPFLLGCLAAVPSTIVTVTFAHAARSATRLGDAHEGVERSADLVAVLVGLAGLVAFGWLLRRAFPHLQREYRAARAEYAARETAAVGLSKTGLSKTGLAEPGIEEPGG